MRSSTLMLCGLMALSTTACKKTSGAGAAKEDVALVPRETKIVVMANITRLRSTPMWQRLVALRDSDAQSKKDYDQFVSQCGLDPFKQIDSAFAAFPQGSADQREFAVILRGHFDEQKLIACARDQAKKEGRELKISDYQGKKIYTDNAKGEAFATFLDSKTAVIAGQTWIKKVIDLAVAKGGKTTQSAKDNAELRELLKRVRTNDAVWGAGIVPPATREQFKNDPRLSSAASMKDLFGSIDFAKGVAIEINVDTGSQADAADLATKAQAQLADLRKSPQFMMMGLGQYLDGIKVAEKGATFQVTVNYTQTQVDDLISRVKGLIKSFGGAMGGLPPAATPPTQH